MNKKFEFKKNTILVGDTNLLYDEFTMIDMMNNTVSKYGDKIALVYDKYTLTYEEFSDKVYRFAMYLKKQGIKENSRVTVILPDCIHTVIATYAIWYLGATVAMNNPMYTDRELLECLKVANPEHVICMDSLLERVLKLRENISINSITWVCPTQFLEDYNEDNKQLLYKDVYDFSQCIKSNERLEIGAKYDWNKVACLQFTGGTTGVVKAVVLTHKNLSVVLQNHREWFYDREEGKETNLAVLPFFHVYGMQLGMNLPICLGATNVILLKPSSQAIFDAIRTNGVTCCPLVPTLFVYLLKDEALKDQNFDKIKVFISGGATLPTHVFEKFKEITGKTIIEGYGLSEAGPITHINPYGRTGIVKPGSIGKLCANTEAKIIEIKNEGELEENRKYGELLVRGRQVAQGYYNNDAETAGVFDKEGWLHTGDMVYVDEDEYFYVVGRIKDIIVSSANNIYPTEIESVFNQHPDVVDVAVLGVQNEIRGENVVVFVILQKEATVTKDELMEFAKERLAKYKWPVDIVIKNEFPINSSGKLLKKKLRDEYIQQGQI